MDSSRIPGSHPVAPTYNPNNVARRIIAGTMPPQYCHRDVSLLRNPPPSLLPFTVAGKHKPAPNRQLELHGDFRGARREPIRLAMCASFSESLGCQGLKRMADSNVLPLARTTPSKGQLAIVAATEKKKKKHINCAKSTPSVGLQTSTRGSIRKDLFLFYTYIFICIFPNYPNNCRVILYTVYYVRN